METVVKTTHHGYQHVFPIVVSTGDLDPGRFGERARHMRLELESATTKYQRATRVLQRLGMPARDGKFEFTVTKVDCGKTQIGNQYLNTKAQGQFCLVSMTVTNIGTKPQMFSSINQKAIDAQGRELSADVTAGAYLEDSKSFSANITPATPSREPSSSTSQRPHRSPMCCCTTACSPMGRR